MGNRHTTGHLDALERDDQAQLDVARRHRKFDDAIEKAKAAGFSDRHAPFAAMAWLTMSALGGPSPTREQIRARVEGQYPDLFGAA